MAKKTVEMSLLVIKGQNHYRGNIVSLFNSHAPGFEQELEIDGILEPEPTNSPDPNAVVLRVRGYVVGYITQENAAAVKSQIGSGIQVGCKLIWNRDPMSPMISVVITSLL